jgi:hypothetical protein
VPSAIAAFHAPAAIVLSPAQKQAFAGNCIALAADAAWMSAAADAALSPVQRELLAAAGFAIHAVALDELEKAGGSLRCCVAEIFQAPPGRRTGEGTTNGEGTSGRID